MVRPKSSQPQNTTISAVIVLERYEAYDPEFLRAFNTAVVDAQDKAGRLLTAGEKMDIRIRIDEQFGKSVKCCVPRVRVHENPFARIALPEEVFRGPYDERWRYADSLLQRVFAGVRLLEIEALEAAEPPDTGGLDDDS